MSIKQPLDELIETFMHRVKSVPIVFDPEKTNMKHSGKEGLWLERSLGLHPNSNNAPDFKGYEIKNTKEGFSKPISFGDYSASQYIFSKDNTFIKTFNKDISEEFSRSDFLRIFGTAKPLRKNPEKSRYSWSGKCAPKYYNKWSESGQILLLNDDGDLCIFYCFEQDKRENRFTIIHPSIQCKSQILIAVWFRNKLETHINNKFNKKGIVFVERTPQMTFETLKVGNPFDYEHFIHNLIHQRIYFDSGMYEGNNRQYSMFRCSNNLFWKELLLI
jgi:hypothetical protein